MGTHPLLYEINIRCRITELSATLHRQATLRDFPKSDFVLWQQLGITHVWLMGVWPCGPKSWDFSLNNPHLREVYSQLLGDWAPQDVGGSTYSIQGYHIDPLLGGPEALANFRERLQAHGIKLILDFIPNHIGLDHPWITQRPDLLITRKQAAPSFFPAHQGRRKLWIAHGRDPYFPPWMDTAQLDHRNPATRHALIHELHEVAKLCDGVRCDMAMLVLNEIFAETWKQTEENNPPPKTEFWADAITSIRERHPQFIFLAEAYWQREPQLQHLGFDHTYEKTFLDHLAQHDTAALQSHLHHRPALAKDARFLENHDEPRIANRLTLEEQKAAALLWLSLPGLKLLHEGQMEGWRQHVPVHLCRRPTEATNGDISTFYEQILRAAKDTPVGKSTWRIPASTSAWPGNPSHQNIFTFTWQSSPAEFELIVVNYASHASQCYINLAEETKHYTRWELRNRVGDESYLRERTELESKGLYLDIPAWGTQWFCVQPHA